MKIGILGAGQMGQTLARLALAGGHQVKFANHRGPESLAELVAELGPGASAGTPDELPGFGDLVILATRWDQTPTAVGGLGPLIGTVLVDTTNNRTGPNPEDMVDIGDRTSSEVVADLVPGARLVKAFNHQPIPELAHIGESTVDGPKALYIAGDDDGAKAVVAELIRSMGAEAVDIGGLRAGGLLQRAGGVLTGHGGYLSADRARAVLAGAG